MSQILYDFLRVLCFPGSRLASGIQTQSQVRYTEPQEHSKYHSFYKSGHLNHSIYIHFRERDTVTGGQTRIHHNDKWRGLKEHSKPQVKTESRCDSIQAENEGEWSKNSSWNRSKRSRGLVPNTRRDWFKMHLEWALWQWQDEPGRTTGWQMTGSEVGRQTERSQHSHHRP